MAASCTSSSISSCTAMSRLTSRYRSRIRRAAAVQPRPEIGGGARGGTRLGDPRLRDQDGRLDVEAAATHDERPVLIDMREDGARLLQPCARANSSATSSLSSRPWSRPPRPGPGRMAEPPRDTPARVARTQRTRWPRRRPRRSVRKSRPHARPAELAFEAVLSRSAVGPGDLVPHEEREQRRQPISGGDPGWAWVRVEQTLARRGSGFERRPSGPKSLHGARRHESPQSPQGEAPGIEIASSASSLAFAESSRSPAAPPRRAGAPWASASACSGEIAAASADGERHPRRRSVRLQTSDPAAARNRRATTPSGSTTSCRARGERFRCAARGSSTAARPRAAWAAAWAGSPRSFASRAASSATRARSAGS